MSVPMSFAREAQPLLPNDVDLEDAVDATETGAQARPLLSVGETLEDYGGQESLDDWLTRRFCEGRLSALQSARGAAAAVCSGAQGDRVVAVAQWCKAVLAERPALRAAPRSSGVPSPTSVLGRRSLVEPIGSFVCVHASASLADSRARLAAGV